MNYQEIVDYIINNIDNCRIDKFYDPLSAAIIDGKDYATMHYVASKLFIDKKFNKVLIQEDLDKMKEFPNILNAQIIDFHKSGIVLVLDIRVSADDLTIKEREYIKIAPKIHADIKKKIKKAQGIK